MAVRIGHASIDENGKAQGGVAGDQTGREVCTRDWYNKPWICIIRAKDRTYAEKIAKAMEQACANDKIGYDQYQRTTLYTQAKVCGWNLSKITVPCETDCSALVAVCVNAAGIRVSKDIYTGNEKSALVATGKFDTYTSSDYTRFSAKLKRGDILLGNGHTAIVLSNGTSADLSSGFSGNISASGSTSGATFSSKPSYTTGKVYKLLVDALRVRSGAGKNHAVKAYSQLTANAKQNAYSNGTLKKGTRVTCQEVKTVRNDIWIRIPSGWIAAYYNGEKYVG